MVIHQSPAQCAQSLRSGRVALWLASDQGMPSQARHAGVSPEEFRKVLEVAEIPSYIAFSKDTPRRVVESWQAAFETMKDDGALAHLRVRWLPRFVTGLGAGANEKAPIALTSEEQLWLHGHKRVRIGTVNDFPPLGFSGDDDENHGVTADYVSLVQRLTGLGVETVTMPWPEVLQSLRAGKVDIVASIVRTEAREKFLLFTKPYLVTPSVIIVRNEAPFLTGIDDLAGGTVAVVNGFYTQERLYRDHPHLQLRVEPTVLEALTAVSMGRADAYLGDLASATHYIRNAGLTNLKVAARTEYGSDEISMAVRKDQPLLRDILDKALASVSQAERDAIYDKWVSLPFGPEHGMQKFWRLAGHVSLGLAVALALALLWMRRLRREISERARAEGSLAESERRYRNLFENAQAGILLVRLADGVVIAANQRMAELFCYDSPEEFIGDCNGESLLGDLDVEQRMEDRGQFNRRFLNYCREFRQKGGGTVWLDCSGFLDGETGLVTLVAQDVSEQRKVGKALRVGESMMRSLVDAIPFYVAYLGTDRRYRLLNSPGASLLGLDPGDVVGSHVSDLVPADVWALFRPYEDQALAGQEVRADVSVDYLRREGAYTAFYSPDIGASGKIQGVAVCLVDITEQKRVEAELRISEQRYRSVVERSKDAIVIISLAGRLLFGNSKASELFGYTLEEARGMDVSPFFPPEEWPRVRGLLSMPGELTYETRMLDRNGRVFNVENSRAIISYEGQPASLVLVRDVTERKRAEELLRKSEERLQMAIDSTDFGLWELRTAEDLLELPAKLFCDKYGYDPQDLPKTIAAWKRIIHTDDMVQARKAYKAYMEQGVENLRSEYRVLDALGGWRWVAVHAKVVERESNGKPRRLLGLVQDITERKQVEDKLRELATVDSLTGLSNRRYFLEIAAREVERSRRYRIPLSLVMLDVDRFKSINDTHGHDVGDQTLRALATIGLSGIRTVDAFGRLGGEDFAILLPETDITKAQEVSERLREAFAAYQGQGKNGASVGFTVSFGVTETLPQDSLDSLLRRADGAMYEAKKKGRNRVETA